MSKAGKEPSSKSSDGKKVIAIVVALVILALLAVGVGVAVKVFVPDRDAAQEQRTEREEKEKEDTEEEKEPEQKTEEAENITGEEEVTEEATEDKRVADYDISSDKPIALKGFVRVSTSGYYILQWSSGVSFAGKDDVFLENVKSVRLDDSDLPIGFLDTVKSDTEIELQGFATIEDDKVMVKVLQVNDSNGKDMIAEYEKKQSLSEDYILPASDTVKLTKSDIEDLTLQELNYAKNEIYARHGRKFDSKELREYFESKSWYNGTIDPADFKDNMLSQIERDNVKLIKDLEFSINPNGYQLDQ